jgi:hypothetical protein
LILISLAVERRLKRFNKKAVIAKQNRSFDIMYSLGFLIVELETAKRRLLCVLGRQMVHQQVDLALRQFPKGRAAAPRIGQSCEVGIELDSLNYRRDR